MDEWTADRPCHTADLDLWFAETPAAVETAKALCVPCPLREACLAGALRRREPWGVWGGQLVVGGVVVAHKRGRGRPRKHPLPVPVTAGGLIRRDAAVRRAGGARRRRARPSGCASARRRACAAPRR